MDRLSPKKVSALAFTPDGKWVLFSNKFGEVLAVPTDAEKWVARPDDAKLTPGALALSSTSNHSL